MKEIKILSFKYGGKKVQVDDEDYEFLNRWKWHVSESKGIFYAMRHEDNVDGSRYHVSMHRVIMGIYDPKIEVDHIDHNGLNNQRSNLRNCLDGGNKRNKRKTKRITTSKYVGVRLRVRERPDGSFYKAWVACLGKTRGKPQQPRRSFPYTEQGEIDAAKYYDEQATKHYGEFANLNFKLVTPSPLQPQINKK